MPAIPEQARKSMLDTYVESARLLGERTAAMHLETLASDTEDIGTSLRNPLRPIPSAACSRPSAI